jgi:hypothetical protein
VMDTPTRSAMSFIEAIDRHSLQGPEL